MNKEIQKKVKCVYPLCHTNASQSSQFGLCFKHNDMLLFFSWLKQVEFEMAKQQQQQAKETLWRP